MVREPIEIVVTEAGARAASGQLVDVGRAAGGAAQEVRGLNQQLSSGGDAFDRFERELKDTERGLDRVEKELGDVDRAIRRSSGGVSGFGSTLRTLGAAAVGVLGALGAVAAFRGLGRLASDAIQTAAAFESYEIRLRTLLGSQAEANRALETFTGLASRTPFAVSQIVEGAATLASVALGNRERLELLTRTAANLAAVTGLSFQETAGNLQRALAAGIGAADLFRDRGVRALIESVRGIPDATKLSLAELEAAFVETFGPGGTFGTAAEDLSNSLGGALSNIGDAATNLKAALGEAFAPVVINTARQVLIPFLERLQVLVQENEGSLRDLAANGVKFALDTLVAFVDGGLAAAEVILELIGAARSAVGAFLEFSAQIARADAAVTSFGASLPFAGADQRRLADEAAARLRLVEGALGSFADGQGEAERRADRLRDSVGSLRQVLAGLQANIDRADFTAVAETGGVLPDLSGAASREAAGNAAAETKARREAERAAREQAAALARVVSLTDRLRVSTAQQLEPLDAQLERLRQQREELLEQARLAGEVAAAREGLALIDEQVAEVERERTALATEQEALFVRLNELVQQLGASAPDFAASLERAALAAVAAGGGLAAVNGELRQLVGRGTAELQREQQRIGKVGEEIGRTLAGAVGDVFSSSLRGEAINFAEVLASTSGKLLQDSLDRVLANVGEGLQALFSRLGGEGGLGGVFGQGFGAALGLGLGVLAGALQGSASEVTSDFVQSAVTEARDVRGVVAGPTSIPIFQLGDALEEALVETNGILRQQLRALERLAAGAVAGASGVPAVSELGTTSASLG